MSRDPGVVIVGGGPAAWSCAFELRARNWDGALTLICGEPSPPYDRTLVSKDCLHRAVPAGELRLSDEREYGDARVRLRLGVAATSVDLERRRLELSDQTELPYATLVIATGAEARSYESVACEGAHTLRTLADARRLRASLAKARRLVIVGGGFIGGEVASAACAVGLEVVLIESLDAPLAHILGPEVADHIAQLHRRAGVEVRARTVVRAIRRHGDTYRVVLRGGEMIETDVVLVAIGSRPAVDWLSRKPGISFDDGIVTDERCRTEIPGVYAVGDCARWRSPRSGLLTRVEHWETAIEHGAAAARVIAGGNEPFAPVPFVWSIQHGCRLQWVGDSTGWDAVEIVRSESSHGVLARYSRGGELCGAFAVDDPRQIASVRRELVARELASA